MPPRRRNPSIDMDVDDPFAFASTAAAAAAESLTSTSSKANPKTDVKQNQKTPATSSTKASSAVSVKKEVPTPASAKSTTTKPSPASDSSEDEDASMSFSAPRPRGRPKGTFRKLNLSADQAAAAAAAMRETALRIQEMQRAHAQARERSRGMNEASSARSGSGDNTSPPRKRGRPIGSTVPTSQASLKRAREAAEAAGGEHTDAGAEAFRQALMPMKPRILAHSLSSPMKKATSTTTTTMTPFSKAGTSTNRAMASFGGAGGGAQFVKRGRGRPPKYPRPLAASSSSSSAVNSKPRATILDLEAAPPLSQKDDVCCICHDGGILFVCESCVHAYHEVCLERYHVDNFDTMKSLADDQPLYCSDVHLECTTRKVPKQEASLKRQREGEEEEEEEDANDSKKFKWIGKKSHMANGRRYYNSFSLRGNIYTVGSFVTLKNNSNDPRMMVPTKKSNAASPKRCLDYVGQIDEMYEDNSTGYKYIVHRWLYLPEETRSGRLPHHLYNEIFMTAHMDHNDIEAIERSVEVVDFEEWQRRQEEEAVAKKNNPDADSKDAKSKKKKNSEEKKEADAEDEDDDDDNSPDAYDLFVVRQTYDDDRGEFRPYLAPKSRVVRSTKNNIAHGELFSPPNIKTGRGNATATPGPGGKGQSIYSQACAQLQLSAAPPRLPCRDKERDFISRFIERGIRTGQSDGGLYIAGVPGTGKTATVVRVISELAAREDMPNFEYVEINGMKLPDPHQLYTALWKALTGKHSSPMKAVQMLDQRFKTTNLRRPVCVLLVDELDYIMTRQQNVIYNLFDWPARRAARLIVIGISNTIDLPDLLLPRVNSRLGLTKLHFEPYNTHQILEIIQDRLRELPAFAEDAIELCARKIASVSGDIRRALQICRRAAEICEEDQLKINTGNNNNNKNSNASQSKQKNLPPPPAKAGIIGEHHILRAISDLQNSNFIHYLQHSASVYDKLLLSGMLSSIKYSASPSGASNAALHSDTNPPIPLLTLIDHTERNADVRGVRRLIASKVGVPIEDFPQKTSVAEWFLLVQQWAQLKIAQLNYPRGERWPTVQLNILTDDLEHAFKDEELWEKLRSQ